MTIKLVPTAIDQNMVDLLGELHESAKKGELKDLFFVASLGGRTVYHGTYWRNTDTILLLEEISDFVRIMNEDYINENDNGISN